MSNSKSVIRTQKRKKIQAVEHFGGECVICGYKKCVNSLGFHHIDESTKAQSPTYVILHWSWERAIKELEKCILVCSNCHGEIHAELTKVPDNYFIFNEEYSEKGVDIELKIYYISTID